MIDGRGRWPYLSVVWFLGLLFIAAAALVPIGVGLHYSRRGRHFDSAFWLGWVLGVSSLLCLVAARKLGIGGP